MRRKPFLLQILLVFLVLSFSVTTATGQTVCGDVNDDGTANIVDALLISQCYVGLIDCPSADIGDVNCDESINIVDALLIAQLYVGLISQLNCCDTPDTPTPTPDIGTPTPVITALPGVDLKLQYRCQETSQSTNQISVLFLVVNTGSNTINLDDCEVYYYYTREGTANEITETNWVQAGEGAIEITLVNAEHQAITAFTSTAGTLAPGQTSEVQYRIHKEDWSNYDQADDLSWDPTYNEYADYSNITLVYQGAVVWGIDIPAITPTPSPTPTPTCDGTCPPASPLFLYAYEYDRASDNDYVNNGLRGDRTDGVDFEDNWQGGFNTGWVSGGEWLEWDADVVNDGDYTVYVRAAHDDVGTLTGEVYVNDDLVGLVSVPNTDEFEVAHPPGNWQTWVTFEIGSVYLASGTNVVRLEHTGAGSFNVHYVYLGNSPPPAPTSVPRPGGYTEPISRYGRLQVNGSNVCDSSGSPVQLTGISAHDMRWHWLAAKHTVQNLAYTQGVELFRLVVYVDPGNYGYIAAGHRDVLRQFFFAFMDDCVEAGIYAMIDWHVLKDMNPQKYQDEAIDFFTEVSQMYGDYEGTIFEICNEPNGGATWAQVKSYAEAVIPHIRSNSSNIVVVGNPSWSSQPDVASADPPSGSNLAYSLHFYAASHGQDYRDRAETCIANGAPVFATEWGTVDASGMGSSDFAASAGWVSWMASNNISWCNWAFCNKAEGASQLKTHAGFTGPWSSSDWTATGQWIMDRM